MTISPGKNFAIKVPEWKWAETVAFHRDRVGLEVRRDSALTVAFDFGDMTLQIDPVTTQSQVDV